MMSAFMVSRDHISYLVQAAMSRTLHPDYCYQMWVWDIDREAGTYQRGELRTSDHTEATRVGQMLWYENRRSIEARYPDTRRDFSNAPGPVGESYVYEFRYNPTLHIDPVRVIKACHCLYYQSCEHDEWPESEAKAFLDSLIHTACGVLPGYDEAEWEIHDSPETVARCRIPDLLDT